MREDPLGARYSVNKYAIIVESDDYTILLDCHARLLALLMIEGWQMTTMGSQHSVKHSCAEATGVISQPGRAYPTTATMFDIGVYD